MRKKPGAGHVKQWLLHSIGQVPANALRRKTSAAHPDPDLLSNTLCPSFRVTMEARRRHFRATPPGVERMVSPFDRRILGHVVNKLCKIWEELKKIVRQQGTPHRS